MMGRRTRVVDRQRVGAAESDDVGSDGRRTPNPTIFHSPATDQTLGIGRDRPNPRGAAASIHKTLGKER